MERPQLLHIFLYLTFSNGDDSVHVALLLVHIAANARTTDVF